MPLVVYKRANRTHANLPITLTTTIALIFALLYLQVLYAISYFARPFWSSSREFPPYRHNIEAWEKRIIDLILTIVPFSNYRSPNPSSVLHPDGLGHRAQVTSYASSTHVAIDGFPGVPQKAVAAAYTSGPPMPQCYPETAIERMTPTQAHAHRSDLKLGNASTTGSVITKPSAVIDRYGKNGISTYDSVKVTPAKSPPDGRVRISGISDLSQTPLLASHGHTNSHSSQPQAQSLATRSTQSLHRHHHHHHDPEQNNHAAQSIEERDEENDPSFKPLHQVHNLNAFFRPSYTASLSYLPSTPRPSQKSPVNSLDGPHDLGSAVQSIMTAKSDLDNDNESGTSSGDGDGKEDGLKMKRATKCHSTESYPGKFPVSEGMEFSSLATAEYAFRERGTVTVRPFSDY
ncbi:uncharacterized protein N7483_004389 [Penicillium malachiteum]|uniref:uncharacterized protein n=1 Tax=Penicillium malachiteum TaxID=1324776 RepID=UPI002549819C|nr:uncharacterized protein N7483_004389 [Penicillium malachiteum]KAJ5729881.1 hypothetical protein N7483_004389 [Penicillium malachiteum]